ncbi:MAG: hypothetical protein ACRC3Y_18125 [Romboutsia sp.]
MPKIDMDILNEELPKTNKRTVIHETQSNKASISMEKRRRKVKSK